ncbi:MAG TPA: hypothetical protein PKO15_08155 [Fibrobacteria bacterium]|nr:hypothetical protein [Fibrobacteria bacterium]
MLLISIMLSFLSVFSPWVGDRSRWFFYACIGFAVFVAFELVVVVFKKINPMKRVYVACFAILFGLEFFSGSFLKMGLKFSLWLRSDEIRAVSNVVRSQGAEKILIHLGEVSVEGQSCKNRQRLLSDRVLSGQCAEFESERFLNMLRGISANYHHGWIITEGSSVYIEVPGTVFRGLLVADCLSDRNLKNRGAEFNHWSSFSTGLFFSY